MSIIANGVIIASTVVDNVFKSVENYNRLTAEGVELPELPPPDADGYYVYDTDGSIKKIPTAGVAIC